MNEEIRTLVHCALCASGEHEPPVHGPYGVGCFPPIYDEAARIPEDHFVEKLREDNGG